MKQQRRTSVPWLFHVVLAVLFVAFVAPTPYGITWDEGWSWSWDFDGFLLFVAAFVCLAVAPVAALLEVAAVVHGARWLARLVAALYLLPVGILTSLPVTFRLVGDTWPTEASSLAMFVQAYALFAAVQLGFAQLLVGPVRSTVPVTDRAGETRLAAFHRSLYGSRRTR